MFGDRSVVNVPLTSRRCSTVTIVIVQWALYREAREVFTNTQRITRRTTGLRNNLLFGKIWLHLFDGPVRQELCLCRRPRSSSAVMNYVVFPS